MTTSTGCWTNKAKWPVNHSSIRVPKKVRIGGGGNPSRGKVSRLNIRARKDLNRRPLAATQTLKRLLSPHSSPYRFFSPQFNVKGHSFLINKYMQSKPRSEVFVLLWQSGDTGLGWTGGSVTVVSGIIQYVHGLKLRVTSNPIGSRVSVFRLDILMPERNLCFQISWQQKIRTSRAHVMKNLRVLWTSKLP